MNVYDIAPKMLVEELLRLEKLDPGWCKWRHLDGQRYECSTDHQTWIRRLWSGGGDAFSMKATAKWFALGPKLFIPTTVQCQALENVKVNLTIDDYTQPYPALLVKVNLPPVWSVLCYNEPGLIIAVIITDGHLNDIVTTIARTDGGFIEESLNRFDPDCSGDTELLKQVTKALRIALNSCLALSHFGSHLDYLLPKEVESDRRLARERTERGDRARKRLPLAVQVATLDQQVVLHRTVKCRNEPGEPTGREMPFGFRAGHWAMMACGLNHSERRRTFRRPTIVRADLFVGELANTRSTYHT